MATLRDLGLTVNTDDGRANILADQDIAAGMGSLRRGWESGRIGTELNPLRTKALDAKIAGDAARQAELDAQVSALEQRQQMFAPRVSDLRDINGVGDGLDWFTGQAGQGAASMLDPVAAAAGLGVVGRVAGAIPHPIAKGIGLAAQAGQFAVPWMMSKQQLTGEFIGEAGHDKELMARTSPQGLRDMAGNYGVVAGGLDSALPGMFGRQITGLSRAGSTVARQNALGAGAKFGLNNLSEGATEGAQAAGSQYARGLLNPNRDTSGDNWDIVNNFAGGMAGGSPFSAAGALAEAGHNRIDGGVDAVKGKAGEVVDLMNANPAVQEVKEAGKKWWQSGKEAVIDLQAAVADENGNITPSSVAGAAKGAVDMGVEKANRAAATEEFWNAMSGQMPPEMAADASPVGAAQQEAWVKAHDERRATAVVSMLKTMQDDPKAQELLASVNEADPVNRHIALTQAGGYVVDRMEQDSLAEEAGVAKENQGAKLVGALGGLAGRAAMGVGKTALEFGKAALSGAKEGMGRKKNMQTELDLNSVETSDPKSPYDNWLLRTGRNKTTLMSEALSDAQSAQTGPAKPEAIKLQQAMEKSYRRAQLFGEKLASVTKRNLSTEIGDYMRDVGFEIADLAESWGMTEGAGQPVTVAPRMQGKGLELNLSNIANSMRVALGKGAIPVLDQLQSLADPKSVPMFDILRKHLQVGSTPEAREERKVLRATVADQVLMLLPPEQAKMILEDTSDPEVSGPEQLLRSIERMGRGHLSRNQRIAITKAVGGKGVLNEMLQTVGAIAEPETVVGSIVDDRAQSGEENFEQNADDEAGTTDFETRAQEKNVAKGVGGKVYGFHASPNLRTSNERRDPFSATEKLSPNDIAARELLGESTMMRPKLFTKGQKLFGGKSAIEKKVADTRAQLAGDPAYPDHANYDVRSKSAHEVMTDMNMQPGKVLQLFRDYAGEEEGAMGQAAAMARFVIVRSMRLDALRKAKLNGEPAPTFAPFKNPALKAAEASYNARFKDMRDGGQLDENVNYARVEFDKIVRAELLENAEMYFKDRFMVVGEKLSNQDADQIALPTILDMHRHGQTLVEQSRVGDAADGSKAVLPKDMADKKLSEANVLMFKTKSGGRSKEFAIPAGDLVNWVRQQRGKTEAADSEDNGGSFSDRSKDDEYLEDLSHGIASLIGSGHVQGMPYKINAKGWQEKFSKGIPESLMLATTTYGAKKFGDEQRKAYRVKDLDEKLNRNRLLTDPINRAILEENVQKAKTALAKVLADPRSSRDDEELARVKLGNAVDILESEAYANNRVVPIGETGEWSAQEDIAADQNRNAEFFTPEDRVERELVIGAEKDGATRRTALSDEELAKFRTLKGADAREGFIDGLKKKHGEKWAALYDLVGPFGAMFAKAADPELGTRNAGAQLITREHTTDGELTGEVVMPDGKKRIASFVSDGEGGYKMKERTPYRTDVSGEVAADSKTDDPHKTPLDFVGKQKAGEVADERTNQRWLSRQTGASTDMSPGPEPKARAASRAKFRADEIMAVMNKDVEAGTEMIAARLRAARAPEYNGNRPARGKMTVPGVKGEDQVVGGAHYVAPLAYLANAGRVAQMNLSESEKEMFTDLRKQVAQILLESNLSGMNKLAIARLMSEKPEALTAQNLDARLTRLAGGAAEGKALGAKQESAPEVANAGLPKRVVTQSGGSEIIVTDHQSSGYRERTKHNADSAGLTVAIAADYTTAGERLTKTVAGSRYFAIPLGVAPDLGGLRLAKAMRQIGTTTLNVAGNGIYTLVGRGHTQASINQHVFELISAAHALHPITKIVTGGQTGVDLAGAVAAKKLGIPAVVTLPRGFVQRDAQGRDAAHTAAEIEKQITDGSAALKSAPEVAGVSRPKGQPTLSGGQRVSELATVIRSMFKGPSFDKVVGIYQTVAEALEAADITLPSAMLSVKSDRLKLEGMFKQWFQTLEVNKIPKDLMNDVMRLVGKKEDMAARGLLVDWARSESARIKEKWSPTLVLPPAPGRTPHSGNYRNSPKKIESEALLETRRKMEKQAAVALARQKRAYDDGALMDPQMLQAMRIYVQNPAAAVTHVADQMLQERQVAMQILARMDVEGISTELDKRTGYIDTPGADWDTVRAELEESGKVIFLSTLEHHYIVEAMDRAMDARLEYVPDMNEQAIAQTIVRLRSEPSSSNFLTEFDKTAKMMDVAEQHEDGTGGVWRKYKQTSKEDKDFRTNVSALTARAYSTWCTSQGAAAHQLQAGDFWVYSDKEGKTQLALRMSGNSVGEIQDQSNTGRVQPEHKDRFVWLVESKLLPEEASRELSDKLREVIERGSSKEARIAERRLDVLLNKPDKTVSEAAQILQLMGHDAAEVGDKIVIRGDFNRAYTFIDHDFGGDVEAQRIPWDVSEFIEHIEGDLVVDPNTGVPLMPNLHKIGGEIKVSGRGIGRHGENLKAALEYAKKQVFDDIEHKKSVLRINGTFDNGRNTAASPYLTNQLAQAQAMVDTFGDRVPDVVPIDVFSNEALRLGGTDILIRSLARQMDKLPPTPGLSPEHKSLWIEEQKSQASLRAMRAERRQAEPMRFDFMDDDIPFSRKADGTIQGFYDPKGKKSYLIADGIAKGEEMGVMLHEVGVHMGMEKMLGAEKYGQLIGQIKKWENGMGLNKQIAQAARARVAESGATGVQADHELLAYFVEEAVKAGIDPTKLGTNALAKWMNQVWEAVKVALSDLGWDTSKLQARDVVALAHGAAQIEMGAKQPAKPNAPTQRGGVGLTGGPHVAKDKLTHEQAQAEISAMASTGRLDTKLAASVIMRMAANPEERADAVQAAAQLAALVDESLAVGGMAQKTVDSWADKFAGGAKVTVLKIPAGHILEQIVAPNHGGDISKIGGAYVNIDGGHYVATFVSGSKNKATSLSRLAHEFGHALQAIAFDNAPQSTKQKLLDAYAGDLAALGVTPSAIERFVSPARLFDDKLASELNELPGHLSNGVRANTAAGLMDHVTAGGSAEYIKSFDEWFAENFSKFVTSDVQANLDPEIRSFWASLLKGLKRFFQEYVLQYKPNENFKAWVDSLAKRTPPKHGAVEKQGLASPMDELSVYGKKWVSGMMTAVEVESGEGAYGQPLELRAAVYAEGYFEGGDYWSGWFDSVEKAERAAQKAGVQTGVLKPAPAERVTLSGGIEGRKLNAMAARIHNELGRVVYDDSKITTNYVHFNVQDPTSKVSTQAERDAAVAYAKKVLGPKIKVDFQDITGYSGEFIEATNTIVISTTAAAGTLNTLYHEALHKFFADFVKGNPKVQAMFESLVNDPKHLAKLHALLDGYPAAQAQLTSGEERLAYTYQFWKAGLLEVDAKASTWLQKLGKFFRRVAGRVRDSERALELFEAFDAGKMSEPSAAGMVIAKAMAKGTATLKFRRKMDAMFQGLAALTVPSAEILGMSVSPTARKLSTMFFTNPGEEAHGNEETGLLNARRSAAQQYVNTSNRRFEGMSQMDKEQVQEHLQNETPLDKIAYAEHREAVKDIRQLLERFHKYMVDAGMDIGKIENYYPVVWNVDRVMSNKAKFINMLVTKYAAELAPADGDVQKAAERVYASLVSKDGIDKHLPAQREDGVLNPFFASQEMRTMPWLKAEDRAEYLEKDMPMTLTRYFNQGVHAAEYRRRFGKNGIKLEKMLATINEELSAAGKEMLRRGEFKDEAARVKWVGRQMRDVVQATGAMEGSLGKDVSPNMRKFNSWMTVYQNVRLLPMALFSSFVDPLALVARGAPFKAAYETFVYSMREVFRNWGDAFRDMPPARQKDEWRQLSELIGASEIAVFQHQVSGLYASTYMTPGAKKINDKMFTFNGMEAWNRGTRIMATKWAVRFLEQHAGVPDKNHSARWLKELGLTPAMITLDDGKLVTTPQQLMALKGITLDEARAQIAPIHEALNRWVEGAVLTPNAAQRPSWGSDPNFATMFHLKQFSYSFHQTILKRAANEFNHGNVAPLAALAAFIPTMIGADIMKGLIQGGGSLPPYMAGMNAGDWVMHATQRAGLHGIGVIGVDAANDWASLGGPAFEQIVDAGRDGFGSKSALNALPLHSLYGQLAQ